MHAGAEPLSATFWLVNAPDSLARQSGHNPDGAGIGCFAGDGSAVVDKQPLAAWQDPEFFSAARDLTGTTFVAHVRYASTGGHTLANTHPFLADERLFAHNGVVLGLDRLDRRLDELGGSQLIHGQTDSERMFALITAEIRRRDGDVTAGLVAAISWIGETLPVYALNLVLSTSTDLWALRYPDTHELYVLERPRGGRGTDHALDVRTSRISARSQDLGRRPAVIVASERMDDDPSWRLLAPGELLHVGVDLNPSISTPFAPPVHQLTLSRLDLATASSQARPAPTPGG